MPSRADLVFDPPGPGTWMVDTQHNPNPISLFKQEYVGHEIATTIGIHSAEYGVMYVLSAEMVHGFMYGRGIGVGGGPGSSKLQDTANLAVAERIRKGQRAYNEKLWLQDLELWNGEVKPDSIRRNTALASVVLDELDHDGIVSHIAACRDNSIEMIRRHHQFSLSSVVASGLLFLDVMEWTGLDATEIIGLLKGASPVSSGVTPNLVRVVEAVRADRDARNILESEQSPTDKLELLRSSEGPVGKAISDYLLVDGHRLATGFDIFNQCLLELPATIEWRIRQGVTNGLPTDESAPANIVEKVRGQVPEQHRESFDALLSDARRMARLKDERGIYNDIWADGIVRQAILAGGQMLVRDGALSDPELLLEASWPEMQLLLRGSEIVSKDDLVARREFRTSLSWRDVPAILGPPPTPPAPFEGLPPEVDRLRRAIGTSMSMMGGKPKGVSTSDLNGTAASTGVHEGHARLAVGTYDFGRIEHGDVLVTSTHSAAFNVVAGRVGAVVTDTGGFLSHLAIVAREYGIPCVVACKNATTVIAEGALVRVDGNTGLVTVVS